jgi:hypothetical protein
MSSGDQMAAQKFSFWLCPVDSLEPGVKVLWQTCGNFDQGLTSGRIITLIGSVQDAVCGKTVMFACLHIVIGGTERSP